MLPTRVIVMLHAIADVVLHVVVIVVMHAGPMSAITTVLARLARLTRCTDCTDTVNQSAVVIAIYARNPPPPGLKACRVHQGSQGYVQPMRRSR